MFYSSMALLSDAQVLGLCGEVLVVGGAARVASVYNRATRLWWDVNL